MNELKDFSKSWLPQWLVRLSGLKPTAQAIGVWLAAQANNEGEVSHLNKQELCASAGVHLATLRRELAPSGELVDKGLVTRHMRKVIAATGNEIHAPTVYQLDVW